MRLYKIIEYISDWQLVVFTMMKAIKSNSFSIVISFHRIPCGECIFLFSTHFDNVKMYYETKLRERERDEDKNKNKH